MIRLIKYIYYRISHVYDQKESWFNFWYYDTLIKDMHYKKGGLLTGSLIGGNLLSIFNMFKDYDIVLQNIINSDRIILLTCMFVGSLMSNKKNYQDLDEKYKNERFRIFKGWLVVVYIIATFVLYYISL